MSDPVFTFHSALRLMERGITRDHVMAAVTSGRVVGSAEGKDVYALERLRVVVARDRHRVAGAPGKRKAENPQGAEGQQEKQKAVEMKYLSVCSGIEAATVAWQPLGWRAAAFAEIEKFPSAVLAFHYPDVPNLGDMTKINGVDFQGKIDVLVGGTPCQSFSVAGLRGGLDDERGNLALEFARIADECAPPFIVWENVPGIFSDRGNAFGCFLAALAGEDAPLLTPGGKWTDAGYVLGPRRAIAWRILDAQYFGLAQRRRRVFLVGCPRDRADPRAILFEREGLRRDTPPGRKARQDVAGTLEAGLGRSRGAGTPPGAITQALTGRLGGGGPDDNKAQGGFYVAAFGGNNTSGGIDVSPALNAHGGGSRRMDFESEAFIARLLRAQSRSAHDESLENHIAHALRADGFDASEDGTGRGTPLVAAIAIRGREDGCNVEMRTDGVANAILTPSGGRAGIGVGVVLRESSVRRLTPRECERLQGFPDDYTLIPWRGKPASECADGPRYKALGNSMAVPVMRWIGERIERFGRSI